MNVRLRSTRVEDLEFVVGAENHPDNCDFVSQWSRAEHEAALSDGNKKHFIVENVKTTEPVGYVILEDVRSPHKSVCLKRIVMTEKGKGYGRETLRLAKRLVFESLKAHRLWLDVKDYNTRAKLLYESEGFVVEGLLRDCCRSRGQFESYYILSMLEDEYFANGKE
ncbi:GNAT family N-acetyltransferase [Lyngbya sp. CCY1209]|jgi:RimJ/RimL family protein N-acetyltransferase|uniref:GNAT family N-acetyltransferase n=1 Tax=Lyngbya sp. CCY1209 TaxID=2886103 RepID=UPI002D210601|nr:GNAT family N-acetyltransferase [Lyngbya sp. CCY1209]MEB3887206.1 GNAT family N-acetyltransferase [Lyngbya sp. CCY1209]